MTTYRSQYTYSAASSTFTPGVTPTDIFAITGSATANVYVLKMGISLTSTAAGTYTFYLAKRSTANATGTHAAPAIVPFDSNNPAATATVLQYTVNPGTLGTLVGYAWSGWVNSPIITTASIGQSVLEINFEDMFGQPLSLLSTSEVLAWNFQGAALPGGLSVNAYVVWTEGAKT
jgi:hypothetical protein